ncbi:MAG: MBL fold metallo-hydrolase [Verrucomicrobiae bacterium]|nr:MBL fold metallo-hydrolase [Verrucomicrobiae bacterium]
MGAKLTILGSGSGGNAAFLECGETAILIDAGLSGKQIRERLGQIGKSVENLSGIIISHEHTDHINGLAMVAARFDIPVYTNRLTSQAICEYFEDEKFDFRIFQTGNAFEIGNICVEVFPVPHDSIDPVGFTFETNEGKIGFVTDLGHVTKLVVERVRSAHVLVVESNHDVKMLQENPNRPWSLKQRILGRHGHLSNESAAELVQQVVNAELQHLILAHLSEECNRPELALKVMKQKLVQLGACHVDFQSAFQDKLSKTVFLKNRTVLKEILTS